LYLIIYLCGKEPCNKQDNELQVGCYLRVNPLQADARPRFITLLGVYSVITTSLMYIIPYSTYHTFTPLQALFPLGNVWIKVAVVIGHSNNSNNTHVLLAPPTQTPSHQAITTQRVDVCKTNGKLLFYSRIYIPPFGPCCPPGAWRAGPLHLYSACC